MGELLLELPVSPGGGIGLFQFVQRRNQRFGDKPSAIASEISSSVR
jgi:hypothetical protein